MADWNPLYGNWINGSPDPAGVNPKTYIGVSAADYKALIGKAKEAPEIKPASRWGGTVAAAPFALSIADFKTIVGNDGRNTIAANAGSESKIQAYLTKVSEAFALLGIDTVEAQALFLAHGAGETAFSKLTEGQTNPFEDTPANVIVDTVDPKGPTRYAGQKDIDPTGVIVAGGRRAVAPSSGHAVQAPMSPRDFDKTFIGRGPIQVTWRYGYVQALVYMDKARDGAAGSDAARLGSVYDAIRSDPTNGADPQYSFIFSTTYMHMAAMVRASPWGFTTAGMSGGVADPREPIKRQAYLDATRILKAAIKKP